jgi:hypothetical protein
MPTPHASLRNVRPPCAPLCGKSNALLLLFTNGWGRPERSLVDAVKAELSALSAALLVLSDEQLFYLNSEPGLPTSALPAALARDSLSSLRRAYGDVSHRPDRLTLSLLEPDGRERFRISRTFGANVPGALLEALQIARQSVALPASFRTFSERELLFYSLVGALTLVLTEGAHHDGAASYSALA